MDGISSPERRHREALEYAEEDEAEQTMEESKLEAHANIPNIPVPRSSDGKVCTRRDFNLLRPVCVCSLQPFESSESALGYTHAEFH